MTILVPQLRLVELVDGVELQVVAEQLHEDEQDSLQGQVDGVVGSSLGDCLPFDYLNESMEEEGEFMKEGVAQLNAFVKKLYVFAEFACQQLDVHLALESGMPGVLNIRQPLLADLPDPAEFPSSQVGEDVIGEYGTRHSSESRNQVV